MDFSEDFSFLEREFYTDFSALSSDRSIKSLVHFERELDRVVRTELPDIPRSTRTKMSLGYLYSIEKPKDINRITFSEVKKLKEYPNLIHQSLVSLSVLKPELVPTQVMKEMNERIKIINGLANRVEELETLERERSLNEGEIDELRALREQVINAQQSFTHGIDPKLLKIAKKVNEASLIKKALYPENSDFVNSYDAWSKTLSDSISDMLGFITRGSGLADTATGILDRLNKAMGYQEKELVDSIRSGKGIEEAVYGTKSSRFRVPAGLSTKKIIAAMSNSISAVFRAVTNLTGPWGMVLTLLVKVIQFLINQRQDQLEFNRNLLKSVGLLNQMGQMRVSGPSTDAEYKSFFQNFYDYLNSQSQVNLVRFPDGTILEQTSSSLDFNLNMSKYLDLMNPLIQGGLTLKSIEEEFGRSLISQDKVGSTKIGEVANLKTPLEDIFAIAQVYNVDPSAIGSTIANWKTNYGTLLSMSMDAIRQMHTVATADFVNPAKMLQSVTSLSDSFSFYRDASIGMANLLDGVLKNRIYGLDQSRDLISGAISEILGLSTTGIMELIRPVLADNPESIKDLLIVAQEKLREEIELTKKKMEAASTEDEKFTIGVRKAQMESLLRATEREIAGIKVNRVSEIDVANTTTAIFQYFPEIAPLLGEKAVNERMRQLYLSSIIANPGLRGRVEVDQATRTLGGIGRGTAAYLMGKSYVDGRGPTKLPDQLSPAELEALFLASAKQVTQQTVGISESFDNFLQSASRTLYVQFIKLKNVSENLWRSITGTKPESQQTMDRLDTPWRKKERESPIIEIADRTAEVTSGKTIDDLKSVTGISISQSTLPTAAKLIDGSIKEGIPDYHYVIDEFGNVIKVLPEEKRSSIGGNVNIVNEKGEKKVEPAADHLLGIRLIKKAGSIGTDQASYSENQYKSLAKLIAKLVRDHGISLEEVFSKINSSPISGLDVDKLKSMTSQTYRDLAMPSLLIPNSELDPKKIRNTLVRDALNDSVSMAILEKAVGKQSESGYERVQSIVSGFMDSLDFTKLQKIANERDQNPLKELADNLSKQLGIRIDLSTFTAFLREYVNRGIAREQQASTNKFTDEQRDYIESLKNKVASIKTTVPASIQSITLNQVNSEETQSALASALLMSAENIGSKSSVLLERNHINVFVSNSEGLVDAFQDRYGKDFKLK